MTFSFILFALLLLNYSGPTLKLRRPVVTKMYKKTIDAFYTEAEEK